MARFRHISTKLVLVLDAGTKDGKKVTKRVTIGNIREDASADALWELAEALSKLLEYPVAEVRLYKVEAVEREDGDSIADENGGVHKESDADADNAPADGGEASPVFASCGCDGALAEDNTVYSRQGMYSTQAAGWGDARANGDMDDMRADGPAATQAFEPCQKSRETMLRAVTATNAGTRHPRRHGERSAAIQAKTRPVCGRPPPLCRGLFIAFRVMLVIETWGYEQEQRPEKYLRFFKYVFSAHE